MDKIRILLIDDHALFREGLSRLIEGEPDFAMVAHCASVGEAIDILCQRPIDLVLLDFDLGKEDGFQFIERARQRNFQGRILMVTAGMADAESVKALRMRVCGIFPKHNSPHLLAEAIRKVMAGETWLDQSSVQVLIEATKRPQRPDSRRPFTERERLVLQGVLQGLSNKEIGARLNISESSVKGALQQLFQKTGVRTRSQLVRIALEERSGEWK
jgi:DNA-binding NarL/FixJ family response regulator